MFPEGTLLLLRSLSDDELLKSFHGFLKLTPHLNLIQENMEHLESPNHQFLAILMRALS